MTARNRNRNRKRNHHIRSGHRHTCSSSSSPCESPTRHPTRHIYLLSFSEYFYFFMRMAHAAPHKSQIRIHTFCCDSA
jgi:hypothetical protein